MEIIYNCRRDCCPSMYYDTEKKMIVIKDDFGGTVNLTKSQFELLKSSYEEKYLKGKDNDRT